MSKSRVKVRKRLISKEIDLWSKKSYIPSLQRAENESLLMMQEVAVVLYFAQFEMKIYFQN